MNQKISGARFAKMSQRYEREENAKKIPTQKIMMGTRKGVAVSYSPERAV